MSFIHRHKRFFIALMSFLCLAAIAVTALGKARPTVLRTALGFVVSPLQTGVTRAANWTRSKVDFFVNMSNLQSENDALKAENAALKDENTRLSLAMQENTEYAKLYELDQKYADYPKTGAEIIAKDPSDWVDAYTVNKGMSSGLAQNMAVLSDGGLFGVVTDCGAGTSTVMTILDDRSSVSAMCARTGDQGFVRGDRELMNDGLCQMVYINVNAQLIVGDEIVTSSMSSVYPKGITIGTVTEITDDPNGLTKTAIITPAATFRRLDKVLIITLKNES
ncbi:MAG: rod shape-determining protein MreC [Firmicutes bacterium]|nr:rod shape-determining protein MreC [Bacillota bacterium]